MTYNSKVIPIGYIFIECATLIFIESAYVHDNEHLQRAGWTHGKTRRYSVAGGG